MTSYLPSKLKEKAIEKILEKLNGKKINSTEFLASIVVSEPFLAKDTAILYIDMLTKAKIVQIDNEDNISVCHTKK